MKISVTLLVGVAMLAACSPAKKDEAVAAATVADGQTGVPECDAYLNKVMACIKDKVPEAQRAQMEQAIKQSSAAWTDMPDKAALAQTCKAASEQAKATYSAMGCAM